MAEAEKVSNFDDYDGNADCTMSFSICGHRSDPERGRDMIAHIIMDNCIVLSEEMHCIMHQLYAQISSSSYQSGDLIEMKYAYQNKCIET